MSRFLASALLGLALASLAGGEPRGESQGVARFTPPPGWARQAVGGGQAASYALADGSAGFVVSPSRACASLDRNADELLAEAQAMPGFRLEADRTRGRHIGSGGRWVSFTYTVADPNRPGQFNYVWVSLVGARGRSVAVAAAFHDAAGFNRRLREVAGMVNSMQLTSAIVVEPGNPPLTRFDLDATEDFLEWLMRVQLTDAQKQTVESEIRTFWRKNDRAQIDGMAKVLAARDQLAALPAEKRELARQTILDGAMKEWRKDPGPGSRMMVEIYDCSHRPIADGAPPLTRQSVDAFAELLCFAAGQVAGVTCPPGAELRSKLADAVAKDYPSLSREQQKRIADMPLAWAALRVAWPDYSDAQRQQCVAAWRQDESIAQLAEILKAAAPAASPAAAPDAGVGGASAPAGTMQAIQRQQMMYQTMSNVMRMQHETNQIIIANMGGGYHYEYRWR